MSGEQALRLTVWFGERDRVAGRLRSDVLLDACARHRIAASCLLRGLEGFGERHALRTQRLLTLSEDLPLTLVAVDAPERIAALLDDVRTLPPSGLMTLTQVRLLRDGLVLPSASCGDAAAVKLTLHLGRRARAGDGRPAHIAAVDALHVAGVAGATVLLGVDGTARGIRRRASFFERNAHVPLLVVSVGTPASIDAALPRLRELLPEPLATLEPLHAHKRDGMRLDTAVLAAAAAPSVSAGADADAPWRQIAVYASEQSRHDGETLHTAIVRRLRAEGAAGATALRGIWGYHGDHAPHGDRLRSLRRRVPVVTVVADTPERAARWLDVVDELTGTTGLVTSGPLFRATPWTPADV